MPSNKEIAITLTLKDEASKKIQSFRSSVKEFSSATKDSIAPITELRQAWLKASVAVSATVGVFVLAAQQIAKLREEQQKLDLTSIKLGVSSEALSKKLYGINIGSQNARIGSYQAASFFDSIQQRATQVRTFASEVVGGLSLSLRTQKIYEEKARKYQEANKFTFPIMGGSIQNPFGPFGNDAKKLKEEAAAEAEKQYKEESRALLEKKAIETGIVEEAIGKTKQLELSGYEYKQYLLNREIESDYNSGVDKVTLLNFENEQRKRFEEDYAAEVTNQQATRLDAEGNTLAALRLKQQKALEEYKRQWGGNGDAVREFQAGQAAILRQAQYTQLGIQTNSQIMRETYLSAFSALQDAMSGFYDTTTGEFKTLTETAVGFGREVIGIVNKMIVKILLAKAVAGIASIFSPPTGAAITGATAVASASSGGYFSDNNVSFGGSNYVMHKGGIIRAHSGLAIDEVPIIAQTGEGVLSRKAMNNLGKESFNRLNNGESIEDTNIHIHNTLVINAWSPEDIYSQRAAIESIFAESARKQGTVMRAIRRYS